MPGSLSNEDEGQDDMDFEDELPGEGGKWQARGEFLPFKICAAAATPSWMRGKGLPYVIVDFRRRGATGRSTHQCTV